MIKKEIWIQIEDEKEFDSVREFIGLVEKNFIGDYAVIVYAKAQDAYKKLPQSWLNDECISRLIEKYGDENVRVTNQRVIPRNDEERKEDNRQILERIAISLESIVEVLHSINDNINS